MGWSKEITGLARKSRYSHTCTSCLVMNRIEWSKLNVPHCPTLGCTHLCMTAGSGGPDLLEVT